MRLYLFCHPAKDKTLPLSTRHSLFARQTALSTRLFSVNPASEHKPQQWGFKTCLSPADTGWAGVTDAAAAAAV